MAGGTLNVPNTFATQTGNVPASELDDNNSTIETYVNNREVAVGTLATRPAAGTRGQWFLATDTQGGTLYADNGTAWVQAARGVTLMSPVVIFDVASVAQFTFLANGDLQSQVAGAGTTTLLAARVSLAFQNTNNIELRCDSDNDGGGVIDMVKSNTIMAQFDTGAPAADEAAVLLRVNRGGTISLSRVSLAAVDTAGVGFRALRVPN